MSEPLRLTPAQQQTLTRLQRLAWLLDHSITVPGTRFRFGLDGIIGLLPGVGDAASLLLGSMVVLQSYRFPLPLRVRAAMVWNLVLDGVLGLFPVIGDLLDIGFRANHKNVTLLLKELEREPLPPTARQRFLGVLIPLVLLAVAISIVLLPVWLLIILL